MNRWIQIRVYVYAVGAAVVAVVAWILWRRWKTKIPGAPALDFAAAASKVRDRWTAADTAYKVRTAVAAAKDDDQRARVTEIEKLPTEKAKDAAMAALAKEMRI